MTITLDQAKTLAERLAVLYAKGWQFTRDGRYAGIVPPGWTLPLEDITDSWGIEPLATMGEDYFQSLLAID